MRVGKMDFKQWTWGGKQLRNPFRIVLSLSVYPLYMLGRLLIAIAVLVSDLSLDSALDNWRDTK